jgi:Na+:H+ antiporter, NhaB family
VHFDGQLTNGRRGDRRSSIAGSDLLITSKRIDYVLSLDPAVQPAVFFLANGILSAISDNVFVATVYINEIKSALDAGTISRVQFELLTIAINTGTNVAERRDAERPGGISVPADLGAGAADPPVLRAHGRDGVSDMIMMTAAGLLSVIYFL